MSETKLCPQCGTEYDEEQRFCPRDGSTLRRSDPASDLVGQVVADRYVVLRQLGEGGMGQVYLAEHVRMGRKSALKVMHPAMGADADAISRFNREATNASRISHPNVCAIYDFGETPEGMIWLAMEYVDGEPLTKLVERTGALPAPRAADIARQTAEALAAAHEMGIVHRDLKPDNIMVARGRDGADLVKVVDFGIAKAGGSDSQKVTKTGLVVGTPEYMSPEQLAGDPVDSRSDIYALGLVTFNMLTGALPFPSETVQEAMLMRLTDRPRTLSEMRAGTSWPPALQCVLDRALAREAAARFATATELARDLIAAVGVMPDAAIAEAGTQMLAAAGAPSAAIPPTRIARASAPLPPSTRSSPAAPPGVARPRQRRALVLAIGFGAIIAIGGAMVVVFGEGDRAVTASSTPAPAATLALSAGADGGGAPTARADTVAPSPAVGSRDTHPSAAEPPAQEDPPAPSLADARAELDAMKRDIDEALERAVAGELDAGTRAILERVARNARDLLPRIPSGADIDRVDARYFRAAALGLLGEPTGDTCALLAQIHGAGRLTRAEEITQLRDSFCRSA